VEAVSRAHNSCVTSLLDAPDQKSSGNMTFRERLEPAPARVLAATRQFHAALRRGHISRTGAEEAFLAMAEALVRDQQTAMEAPSRIGAARTSTREELYRRVSRGRDLLLSSLGEPVTLRGRGSGRMPFFVPFPPRVFAMPSDRRRISSSPDSVSHAHKRSWRVANTASRRSVSKAVSKVSGRSVPCFAANSVHHPGGSNGNAARLRHS